MSNEYIDRITRFLKQHDIDRFEFVQLTKHRAVLIQHGGKSHRVVFAATGSDWRGPENTISDIRHTLGLFDVKPRLASGCRHARRQRMSSRRTRQTSSMPSSEQHIGRRPDKFFGPLMVLKAQFDEEAVADMAQAIAATAPKPEPIRIALRTPWLGKQTRHTTI